jgi:hypothetical protein
VGNDLWEMGMRIGKGGNGMRKWLKLGGRALLGAVVCGFSYIAPVSAMDDMAAFREAITMPAQTKNNGYILRESINFFVPTGHAKLEFIAQTKEDSARMSGALDFLLNDEEGGTLTDQIPFYIDQNKKDMTIYYKMGKEWEKFHAPSLAAVLTDVIATPTSTDIEKEISFVKDVKVLRESDTQRTMFVRLDSDKVADAIREYSEENPADKGTADDREMQGHFMQWLDTGVRKADIWYMWTVDKNSWQTITQSLDLTGVVRETAKAAMDDKSEHWSPYAEELLSFVAYYSDMKEYTVFLNQKAEKKLELPKEAKKAKLVEDMIVDMPAKAGSLR